MSDIFATLTENLKLLGLYENVSESAQAYVQHHDRKVHTPEIALACGLIERLGLDATSTALGEHTYHMQRVRCCVSRCKTTSCSELDRKSGRAARLAECGACPTQHQSGCGPAVRGWQAMLEADRRAGHAGPPPWSMTVCNAMVVANATNAVHIHYFLEQQAAAAQLLDTAESQLCSGVDLNARGAAEATYYKTLHRLLGPYRSATRMHTNFAFIAKTRCVPAAFADRARAALQLPWSEQATYMNGYFVRSPHAAAEKQDEPGEGYMSPHSLAWNRLDKPWGGSHGSAYVVSSADEVPHAEDDWCALPILRHEPFNVKESWHVWNYTSALLRAGPSFCATPRERRAEQFRAWRERQNQIMAWHRANMAFSAYVTAYEPACLSSMGRLSADASVVRRFLDKAVAHAQVEEAAYIEGIRKLGECNVANVTTDDLIEAFGGDVEMLIMMSRALLREQDYLWGVKGSGDEGEDGNEGNEGSEASEASEASDDPPRRRRLEPRAQFWRGLRGMESDEHSTGESHVRVGTGSAAVDANDGNGDYGLHGGERSDRTTASGDGGCDPTQACCWSPARVAEVDKLIGPMPPNVLERFRTGLNYFTFAPAPSPHWVLWAFTLAFAYHKLVPTCSLANPIIKGGVPLPKPNWRCTEQEVCMAARAHECASHGIHLCAHTLATGQPAVPCGLLSWVVRPRVPPADMVAYPIPSHR